MLGKRILTSAYVALSLFYSLSYAGEPIVKPLAKNNAQPTYSDKLDNPEIKVKQERQSTELPSKLDKIANSNNSPIPWATRAAAEQGYGRPNGLILFRIEYQKRDK